MMHKPIHIKDLSLIFPHKICFEDFTMQITFGDRIGIIGQNGCGKSSLLQILNKTLSETMGSVQISDDVSMAYIPQVIQDFHDLSGGEKINTALTNALRINPNVLLLDEPTNHLDKANRKGLIKLLESFSGTLIFASHDSQFLQHFAKAVWHIESGKINVFSGKYDHYIQSIHLEKNQIEQELSQLNRQKTEMHQALMKEQHRAAKSRFKGKKSISQRKWPTIVSVSKAHRGEETSGRKKSTILNKKNELIEKLSQLRIPEIIVPNFSLKASEIHHGTLVSIQDGTVGYLNNASILHQINLTISSKDRIAITGNNGSGKSTFVKALLNHIDVIKTGIWQLPKSAHIGYLDQHYHTLSNDKSVLESLFEIKPNWSNNEIRNHLRHFLFRKNEEVNALVSQLSGGEKARLSLAQIAAKSPKLLILDEMTNNLDSETRQHVIEVLRDFPGTLIVISHDEDFLEEINIQEQYFISNGKFC